MKINRNDKNLLNVEPHFNNSNFTKNSGENDFHE